MKKYISPMVEFIEFEADAMASSCPSNCGGDTCGESYDPGCAYDCPKMYGGTCAGNPYGGA